MINFNSKITKSIIIAIFILSLTISIYVVPASAIVTGSVSPVEIAQIFQQDKYQYFRVRNYDQDGDIVSTYPTKTSYIDFDMSPYTGTSGNNPEDLLSTVYTRRVESNLYFYKNYTDPDSGLLLNSQSFRMFMPVGIQNSNRTTIQFMIGTNDYTNDFFDVTGSYFLNNSVKNDRISFYAITNNGTVNLKSSVYEYEGLSLFSQGLNAQYLTFKVKVFELDILNIEYLDYIYIDIKPNVTVNFNNVWFGITKIMYEGANTQLTEISTSINFLISEIQASSDQQKIFNDYMMKVSEDGKLIIEDVNQNVSDAQQGFDEIIQGITVPLPEPDELLPDHQDIMGQYMDSGGSEGVAAVFSPMFDEKGPIYIMLFSVLSIALISYVLYGKKA